MAQQSMLRRLLEIWRRYSAIKQARRLELKGRWYKQHEKLQQEQELKNPEENKLSAARLK